MTASDIFVQELEQYGVKYVFGLPGDENLHFMEAVKKSEQIDFILVRHEAAAGFMANVYGLLTGKISVAMTTLGAGAMNITTPVAQAFLGAQPALYLTGQKPIRHNMQGKYQLVDVVDVMRPITKFSRSIPSGIATASIVHEAMHKALEERRGPVHIELPMDVCEDEGDFKTLPLNNALQPAACDDVIAQVAYIISNAQRPLILVGGNANKPEISKSLRNFVDKLQIPFFVTMLGKGVVDERSDSYIGTAAMPDNDYVHCAVYRSDLIINVGHDIMEKPPFIMKAAQGPKVIHLNDVPAIADNSYFPQWQVVGDMANNLSRLTETLSISPKWDHSNAIKVKKAQEKSVANKSNDTSFPVKPQYLAKCIRDFMGDKDIISVDNGVHKLWFSRNYPTYEPNTLIIDNALGSMGPSLPGAIAAKLVHPDRTVMAVTGDGGFMMHSQEIETAIRLKLDLIIVILNDNGLGMIRMKQKSMGFTPPSYGVDFNNPDFVKYAESFGAHGIKITDGSQLTESLEHAKSHGGVHVIDVPIDYRENEFLFKEMKMIDCDQVLK